MAADGIHNGTAAHVELTLLQHWKHQLTLCIREISQQEAANIFRNAQTACQSDAEIVRCGKKTDGGSCCGTHRWRGYLVERAHTKNRGD